MGISYAAGHKQMSSLLYQYIMFILYPVGAGNILIGCVKFMIDYFCMLFMRDSIKY
jgi:hypothetical protein